MRKALIPLFLLLALSAAQAQVSSEEVTIDLETQEAEVELEVEDHSGALSYITNYPVSNVQVQIENEEQDCTVEELQPGSNIVCENIQEDNFTAVYNFDISEIIEGDGSYNTFRYTHSVYRLTENYQLRVILPSGSGISEVSNTPMLPENGTTGSTGRRIFVEWNHNPELGETLNFRLDFEQVDTRFGIPQAAVTTVFALLVALTSFLAWKNLKREDINPKLDSLKEDQLQVIELIMENDGSMMQKEIVDKTGFSKAKISEVVSELEERELVEKRKSGRSNKVVVPDFYEF